MTEPPLPERVDVAVVGAGLAGLRCARLLAAAGRRPLVLEASDGVGGRVRTDELEGHRLDRGFQVLFERYPELEGAVDLAALDLRRFEPGADVAGLGALRTLADPRRAPGRLAASLRSGLVGVRDVPALLRWRASARWVVESTVAETTGEARLRSLGLSERLRERVIRPLFAGVFLDRGLGVSSLLLDQAFAMMAAGATSVPNRGMGAIAAQLAAGLPEGSLRLRTRVAGVAPGGVELEDGRRISAGAVVVATEPPEAARLSGARLPSDPRSGTCLWFSAAVAPAGRRIVLDGPGTGPLSTLAVLSAVAPGYAPRDRHTIAAWCPGLPDAGDDAMLERRVRRRLHGWFGPLAGIDRWRLLRVDRITWAQHAQPPGSLGRGPIELAPGLLVAGDGTENASIDGALRSGRTAAERLLEMPARAS